MTGAHSGHDTIKAPLERRLLSGRRLSSAFAVDRLLFPSPQPRPIRILSSAIAHRCARASSVVIVACIVLVVACCRIVLTSGAAQPRFVIVPIGIRVPP